MVEVREIHRNAMNLYQESLVANFKGDYKKQMELVGNAFELEKEAALFYRHKTEKEPTRSVLFASAATMAWQCGKKKEMFNLVEMALDGNVPDEIRDELSQLLIKPAYHPFKQIDK